MEPTRFADDLARIPDTLNTLANTLDTGFPGLEAPHRLGERVRAHTGDEPRVLILGMGSSTYASGLVAREARVHGANVTAELASVDLLPPPAADLIVIAVSATGGSVEVRHAIERYAGTGQLIALTNRTDSAVASAADLTVPMLAEHEASGIASRTFRHTLIVLRQLIAALHADTHPVQRIAAHLPALARAAAAASTELLTTAPQWTPDIAATLAGPLGTWVLAPAERWASSQQAALMLREIPRRPAFASETGDWSHVDVYLTKTQDYRALIFAGSRWDAQALEWMTERGSTWVSVGAELPGALHTLRYTGDTDVRVAQLCEVLVAEQVALHWLRE